MAKKSLEKKHIPKDKTSDVIGRTIQAAFEGVTGIAASDRRKIFRSLGHILQRIRGGKFLSQFKHEWNEYREKGRVRDDYIDTEQHQECFQELLDFLDGDSPDQLRFHALKQILLRAATEKSSDRDSVLPQQYMRIIRSLSAGEVLVFFAAFQDTATHKSAKSWIQAIAEKSGLKFPELVELHEAVLMDKHLLLPRYHANNAQVTYGSHGRLTMLGLNICKFIGEKELSPPAP